MSPPAVSVKQDTRQLLLETGLSILVERGYNATSINDVLQAVNVPKGSFYHYFESKEAFCDEILSYYEAIKSEEFQQLFENERLTPLNRLRAVLLKIMGQMEADAFQTGCLIGNLGQEMSAQSPRLRATLDAIYGRWQERHYRCFEAA